MLRFILGFEAKRNTNHKSFIINNLRCYVSSFRTIFLQIPSFPSKKPLPSLPFDPRRLICPPNHPCSTHSLPLRPRCPLSPCECGASHRRLQRRPRRPATPGAPSTHPLERLHHLQGNFKPVKEGQCFQATIPLKRTEHRLERILTIWIAISQHSHLLHALNYYTPSSLAANLSNMRSEPTMPLKRTECRLKRILALSTQPTLPTR